MNIYALYLQQPGSGSAFGMLLPLVFIFAIFYLLLILPQQRRQKKWQAMLGALTAGDKVVTSGGIRGMVYAIKDDSVMLRVPPDNLRLEVTRGSIVTVVKEEEQQTKTS